MMQRGNKVDLRLFTDLAEVVRHSKDQRNSSPDIESSAICANVEINQAKRSGMQLQTESE